MSSRKSKGRREQRLQELEVKKRSGLIQVIAAVVIMVVLILIKTTATIQGAAWANTNMAIFVAAIVAAGFAGYGSRRWNRARKEIISLTSKRR